MKSARQTALWAAAVASVFLMPSPLRSETKVWGVIAKDTKWTLDDSPYLVVGDVLVKRNARLSILPGVRVLFASTTLKDASIAQFDHLDSFSVAIKVEGSIECVGKKNKRIVFAPASGEAAACSWYGIIANQASDQYTDIAFTDISGANCAVTAIDCSPLVRNCVIERNNVGVNCLSKGNARIYNCVIVENFTAGVKIQSANPVLYNNIIVFNKNNGLWCDGISRVTFQYNCVWGNADGNFLECDPEIGVAVHGDKKNKVPVDGSNNIIANPVFAGSEYDSAAVEKDINLPTDKSRITDTALAKVLYKQLADSIAAKKRSASYPRFSLSKYSPCINAGNPAREFKDLDGTRNDMGIYGGPDK
jgi:Right handed beta helix region